MEDNTFNFVQMAWNRRGYMGERGVNRTCVYIDINNILGKYTKYSRTDIPQLLK
jgi:hypothetical protein